MTTDYFSTFITASADCKAAAGTVPAKPETIAGLQYALLIQAPYGYTSDELLFAVHCQRSAIGEAAREAERPSFMAQPKACLRASPLVKQHGWGLHFDVAGKIALYGRESPQYRDFSQRDGIKVVPGMRSSRA